MEVVSYVAIEPGDEIVMSCKFFHLQSYLQTLTSQTRRSP